MNFADLFRALYSAGLPMFLLAFAMVWWALYRGRLEGETFSDLQASIQALGKARKDKENRQKEDPALEKWFRFGGGFYGLVALYTWLLIEWDDVADFLGGLASIALRLELGALITLFVNLLIESVMNFVTAIAWPAYWLSVAGNPWIWIGVAYGGYWLGIRAAQIVSGRKWREESPGLGRSITGQEDDAGE